MSLCLPGANRSRNQRNATCSGQRLREQRLSGSGRSMEKDSPVQIAPGDLAPAPSLQIGGEGACPRLHVLVSGQLFQTRAVIDTGLLNCRSKSPGVFEGDVMSTYCRGQHDDIKVRTLLREVAVNWRPSQQPSRRVDVGGARLRKFDDRVGRGGHFHRQVLAAPRENKDYPMLAILVDQIVPL